MGRDIRILPAVAVCLVVGSCASQTRAPAPSLPRPAPVCADFSFPIYFDKGSDALTASARAVVDSSVEQVRNCRVTRIEVLGLADADGLRLRNLELSRRRAAHVAKVLVGEGLPLPAFDIEAIGAAGAKDPGGEPEPLRRRTEVVIHASPRSP